jgi:hypothetical protein
MDHPVTPQSSVKDAHLSTGFTSDEARRWLEKFGPNAVPDTALHPLGTKNALPYRNPNRPKVGELTGGRPPVRNHGIC